MMNLRVLFLINSNAYFTVDVRRDDCSRYSPRRIQTNVSMHMVMGPRGGMQVMRAETGLSRCFKTHATRMLRCSVKL